MRLLQAALPNRLLMPLQLIRRGGKHRWLLEDREKSFTEEHAVSLNRTLQVCNRNEHWCSIVMNKMERGTAHMPASRTPVPCLSTAVLHPRQCRNGRRGRLGRVLTGKSFWAEGEDQWRLAASFISRAWHLDH
jgi:hypothetical protein